MPRNFTRIAAAAVLGLAIGHGAAVANEWLETPQAYVAGSGDNVSVGYIGAPPAGQVNPPAVIVGSGENMSVRHIGAPTPAPRDYIAVLEGSGENVSVRHIPLPRS